MDPRSIHTHLLQVLSLILNSVIPTILQLIRQYYDKQPYHTSILRGQDWVQELLNGHPERIRTELGLHKHVFMALLAELRAIGQADSRHVTLEEQLAIFLYASVTGLSVRHLGERFQRSNETISKYLFKLF
jgi:hypothetical protein